jgi:ribosomal protein S10
MPVVTTIKLTGDNHQDVDMVCQQIKAISDETGVDLRDQSPFPPKDW